VDILTADNERLRAALSLIASGKPPPPTLDALLQPPPDLPAAATEVINKIRLTDDKVRVWRWGVGCVHACMRALGQER